MPIVDGKKMHILTFYIGKKDSFEKETTQGDLHRCVEIGESKYRNWCPGKLVIVNTER